MIRPQDILKLLGLPAPPEAAISAPSVAFPTQLSEEEFADRTTDTLFFNHGISITFTPRTVLVYHKSIFVASVGYWPEGTQSFLIVKMAPFISNQAVEAIRAELESSNNPFIAYIDALEVDL